MGRGPGGPEAGNGDERQGGEGGNADGSANEAGHLGHARYLSMNEWRDR
jgi:hypothetical protein